MEAAASELNTSSRHGAHHPSIGEKIAHEHDALRAAGREGSQQLTMPNLPRAGAAEITAVSNDPSAQLHEHILSLVATSSKKSKASITDDAELAEFMRRHPELSQYIKEIKQARDEALKNAEQKQQSPLQSKDNLLAKLDVIATLLEGAPIAPALRMGDLSAKEAFVSASKREFGDEEGAILAEYTWSKAREIALSRAEERAKALAVVSAELLAREENPSSEEKQKSSEAIAAFDAEIRAQFDSSASTHILATLAESRDRERGRLVSVHAWELQVRARVLEGRLGEENATRDVTEYLISQNDLFDRNPEFRRSLDVHLLEASESGRQLRIRCDQAARDIYKACDGWGTTEDLVYRSLENRSQYELRIIRERYREMYNEHLRDRLQSEMSGSELARAIRAYEGSPDNRGYDGKAIAAQDLDSNFGPPSARARRGIASGDHGEAAAVLLSHALHTSATPATAMLEVIRDSGIDAASLSTAEKELGLSSSMEVLTARLPPSLKGEPTITAQRDQCAVLLVEAALSGKPITDELYAQYAALESAQYGLQLGNLQAREHPDPEVVEQLGEAHQKFRTSIAAFCGRYQGLSDKMDQAADEFRVYARSAGVEAVAGEFGEKLGLLYGHDGEAVKHRRRDLEEHFSRYQATQQEFLNANPAVVQRLAAAKEAGTQRGLDSMESVRKAVAQLNSGMSGWGTNEAKCFASLQGKSSAELRMIKQLYHERFGQTVELSVEGDFSDAELDKMHALLVRDHIGVAAADADIAMSGFWGVDQNALRTTLRSLQDSSERSEFKTRFDEKYAGDFYKPGADETEPPLRARTFEQALQFTTAGDNFIAAQSLFEGNYDRAEAALVHAELDGFWGPHGEAAALRLETFKKEDGHLDSTRIDSIAIAYQKQYSSALRSDAQKVSAAEGRWLVSVIDGDETDAAAHKLRHAMGGSFDGTDEKLVREPFSLPPALAARIAEETRLGGLSDQTRTQMTEWADFRRAVVQRYSEKDMYPGRDVIVDLRDELNDHHFRMVKTLINDGKLTKADRIADACAGAGTDEDLLHAETAGLTQAQAKELAEDFEKSGYGKLTEVLESELSGEDRFDILENARGLPETAQEMRDYAARRFKHEDSGILSALVWGGERAEMKDDLAKLQAAVEGSADPHEVDALYRRFGVSAAAFREQKNYVSDVIVNTGTTVIMVGGTVVMVVGSGGTATPGAVAMWSLYLAGSAGVVRAGTKWAIRGEGYGNEELALDGGIMVVDMATAGLIAKIPVGRLAAGKLELMLGEMAAQRGGVIVAEDGTKLTGEVLFRYLAQSSRSLRVVVGAAQGSIDGAIFAPIQTAGVTALQENTWDKGVGDGLLRMGEAGLASVPGGLVTGGVFGGATALHTPAYIKNGQPLSLKKTAALSAEGNLSEAGRDLLMEREAAKGFVTRGDLADAKAAGLEIGPQRSAELIQTLRANTDARFGEGDIRMFEAKIRTQGSLSKLDENIILNDTSNRYVASITEKEIEKRLVATKREMNELQLRASVRGLGAPQREVLEQGLALASDRLSALEDTMRYIAAAKASRASTVSVEPSPQVSHIESKSAASADGPGAQETAHTRGGDSQLDEQVRSQQEFVDRLEKDLADPKRAKFKDVIEESLVEHRSRLADLRERALAARQSAEPELPSTSSSSNSGDDSNPWAYDPSESFAKELESQARGDYDEPLDNGLGGREPFPRDDGPRYDSSDGPALQRAPQQRKTRVMVMELPEPALRPAEAQNMLADDLGVVASKQEIDLGQTILEEAIAAPVAQPQGVLIAKPKASPKIAPSPSVEEILAPQFDQPLFQPAPQPLPQLQTHTATPGLLLGRLTKLSTEVETVPTVSPTMSPRPEPTKPAPAVQPKLIIDELLKQPAPRRPGAEVAKEVEQLDEIRVSALHHREELEAKKHKLEMARSEKKGGAKLKFSKVIDELGDDDLIVEDEEAGQV